MPNSVALQRRRKIACRAVGGLNPIESLLSVRPVQEIVLESGRNAGPVVRSSKSKNPVAATIRLFAGVALAVVMFLGLARTRDFLAFTVQACVANRRITGSPWPCLAVDADAAGYAVVRGPLDKSHIVITPVGRIVGIESPLLRGLHTRTYMQDAWDARAFAYPAGVTHLPQSNLGLAINSKRGRTQDQLHVHVDCIRPSVKSRIAQAAADISAGHWSQLRLLDDEDMFWATPFPGDSLDRFNPIELASSGLKLSAAAMGQLTVAVVARNDSPTHPEFVLLAQLARPYLVKDGRAERLLDHDCRFASQIGGW